MMSGEIDCFMCRHNSKVLCEATKKLPDNICLTIAMMAGCKRCEIDAEMLAIADEIKILKKKRSKNRDRIFIWNVKVINSINRWSSFIMNTAISIICIHKKQN